MIALFKIALFIVACGFASLGMLIVLPVIVGLLFASPILLVNVVGYWLLPKQR